MKTTNIIVMTALSRMQDAHPAGVPLYELCDSIAKTADPPTERTAKITAKVRQQLKRLTDKGLVMKTAALGKASARYGMSWRRTIPVYHLTPDGDQWLLAKQKSERLRKVFED